MFPVLLIAIGLIVLAFGKRLAVLGAAVGALLGVVLLRIFPGSTDSWWAFLIPAGFAVAGFFLTAATKAIVDVVLLVLGALAGAAIALAFLDLFNINTGLFDWILAVLGGAVGLVLVRRFKEWALIVLAGLVGGLLVTRGLTIWLPTLQGALGTLLVIALAGGGIAYQGGLLGRSKVAAESAGAQPATPTPTTSPPPASQPPASPPTTDN